MWNLKNWKPIGLMAVLTIWSGHTASARELSSSPSSNLVNSQQPSPSKVQLLRSKTVNPDDFQPRSTIRSSRLAQSSAAPIEVTGVILNPTATGIEVILETTIGKIAAPAAQTQDNLRYFDIPNATLSLPNNQEFRVDNPAEGIAKVTVSQASASYVRVLVTGINSVPTAQLTFKEASSIASTPTIETELEITVIGRTKKGYRGSNTATATKTDTPLRDIPQSIQIIPQQVIKDRGATNIREAVQNVSGVTLSNSSGNRAEQFTVRGFDTPQFENGFRNDFYVNRTQIELANIDRIEVLKGPASVLFGVAEPSGIINIVTKQPLTTPFSEVSLTTGSYNFFRPTLDVSGPLTDDKKLAYRINIATENAGSFRDRVKTDRFFIAPTLAWQISPDTKIGLEFNYLRDSRPLDRGLVVLNNNQIADIPIDRYLGDPTIQYNTSQSKTTLALDHRFNPNLSLRSAIRYTAATDSGPG